MMPTLLSIGAGGFFGAIARYLLSYLLASSTIVGINTLTVNILGSFLAGILISHLDQSNNLRFFLVVGFLGSFTTFSAFSVDALNIFIRKEYIHLSIYIFANIVISLFAVAIGYFIFSGWLKTFFRLFFFWSR